MPVRVPCVAAQLHLCLCEFDAVFGIVSIDRPALDGRHLSRSIVRTTCLDCLVEVSFHNSRPEKWLGLGVGATSCLDDGSEPVGLLL